MKKQKRILTIIQCSFLLLFGVIFCSPFFQGRFHFFREQAIDENRVQSVFPHFENIFLFGKYSRSVERFVEDSFGFRDTLIRLKNHIDLVVFRTSKKVYINDYGYLFSREFEDRYRVEIDAATDEHWNALFNKIAYLNSSLKARGITLLFVPIPLADSIYPEYFQQLNHVGHGEKIYRKLSVFFDSEKIPYVDVVAELKEHRDEPIYYKTDIHYTPVGSFYVMRAMINTLYRIEGINRQWDYPLQYHEEPFTGGVLNNYLSTFHQFPDTNPAVVRGWKTCSVITDNVWRRTCPEKPALPQTVIFGNSFMTLLLQSGFADEFPVLYPLLVADLNNRIRELPDGTKVVIIEFYEIDVWNFLYGDSFPKVGDNLNNEKKN